MALQWLKRAVVYTSVLLVLSGLVSSKKSSDRHCSEYGVLNESWRSVQVEERNSPRRCDDGDGFETVRWYRFMGEAGTAMPTEPPPSSHRCGSDAPVWVNGTNPTYEDGVVERQACARFSGDVCSWSWTIHVKRCPKGFLIYKLKPVEACRLTYCGLGVQKVAVDDVARPASNEDDDGSGALDVHKEVPVAKVHSACRDYRILNEPQRSIHNQVDPNAAAIDLICDKRSKVENRLWYRFEGEGGGMIPTERPLTANRCGTHAPVWMQGRHPNVEEGAVTRTMCAFWDGDDCNWSWKIKVLSCPGGYFVYKLRKPAECLLAYCTTDGSPQRTTPPPTPVISEDFLSDEEDEVSGSGDDKVFRKNLALHKPTRQSSLWDAGYSGNAVDGVRSTDWYSGSCTHTKASRRDNIWGVGTTDPWWYVDLGSSYPIGKIVIVNRRARNPEVTARISPFDIHVGSSEIVAANPKCGHGGRVFPPGEDEMDVSCGGIQGRYVGIRLPGENRILTLCEVEVYAEVNPQTTLSPVPTEPVSPDDADDVGSGASSDSVHPRCLKHKVVYSGWRQLSNNESRHMCDKSKVSGIKDGRWHRFLDSRDASMVIPTERPLSTHRCGTHAPVWMKGRHPTVEEGAVTRTACAFWDDDECNWSWKIDVMACPGGYFVYKLPIPPVCQLAYCTTHGNPQTRTDDSLSDDEDDVGSGEPYDEVTPQTTMPSTTTVGCVTQALGRGAATSGRPTARSAISQATTTVPVPTDAPPSDDEDDAASVTPCTRHYVLDEPWRSVNAHSEDMCDQRTSLKHDQWYRFVGAGGTMMPTKRPLETNRCGTHAPVWMKGEHPTSIQGAVRRTACAFWEGEECHWSWTIHVMACPAGYYVYKLPKPTICHAAYCTTVPLDEDAEGSGESEGSGDMTYTRRGDTQYKIYTESKTYDDAKKTCAADGGHLAVIKTEAVYNFLLGMIRDADVNKDYWIGLNDKAVESRWTWADGEPLNDGGFTKWAPGEPNNAEGIQDCGQLWAAKYFRWDDDRCYNAKYFICQIGPGEAYDEEDIIFVEEPEEEPLPTQEAGNDCPENNIVVLPSGKYYYSSDDAMTYEDAQTECRRKGGIVAVPRNEEEQRNVVMLKNCVSRDNQFWLGVRWSPEGWVDGRGDSLGSFSTWAPGEPNDRYNGYRCAHIVYGNKEGDRRNNWADAYCNSLYNFVCEVEDQEGCPIPGYIPLNGACYKKFAEPKTYAEARERCAADGGLIAMPRDRATNRFITNLHPGVSWLGLTDINREGQWVFEDGQTLESSGYSSWAHKEPNDADGNEDCAQFTKTRAFWNDVPCSTTNGFTCQIGHGKSVKEVYQGCYKDGERRRLPHAFLVRADMTADVCVQHCRQKGYTYAGTQYYKECWCGSELPTRGPREDSECATPCGGNQKEMCGGEWRLSVYKAMPVADITTVSPEEHECQISDGASYRGNVAVTKSGRTCQRWDQQTPHEHSRTAANYPSSGLEENFCRNPDGTSGVWCYTTDPNKRWELCDVAVCGSLSGNPTTQQPVSTEVKTTTAYVTTAIPQTPGPTPAPASRVKPKVTTEGKVTVLKSTNVTLKCTLRSRLRNTHHRINWYRLGANGTQGVPLLTYIDRHAFYNNRRNTELGLVDRLEAVDDHASLRILRVKGEDSGTYRCEVMLASQPLSYADVNLTILECSTDEKKDQTIDIVNEFEAFETEAGRSVDNDDYQAGQGQGIVIISDTGSVFTVALFTGGIFFILFVVIFAVVLFVWRKRK